MVWRLTGDSPRHTRSKAYRVDANSTDNARFDAGELWRAENSSDLARLAALKARVQPLGG